MQQWFFNPGRATVVSTRVAANGHVDYHVEKQCNSGFNPGRCHHVKKQCNSRVAANGRPTDVSRSSFVTFSRSSATVVSTRVVQQWFQPGSLPTDMSQLVSCREAVQQWFQPGSLSRSSATVVSTRVAAIMSRSSATVVSTRVAANGHVDIMFPGGERDC